jgi:hypothetical protein
MKNLIALFLFLGARAEAQSVADKIKNFQDTTNIKFGMYELVSGPQECQKGELRAITVGDRFTLMLGKNPLVYSLGVASSPSEEFKCKMIEESSFDRNQVKGRTEETCPNEDPKIYDVVVTKTADGIKYSRKNTQGSKILLEETCQLKLRR